MTSTTAYFLGLATLPGLLIAAFAVLVGMIGWRLGRFK